MLCSSNHMMTLNMQPSTPIKHRSFTYKQCFHKHFQANFGWRWALKCWRRSFCSRRSVHDTKPFAHHQPKYPCRCVKNRRTIITTNVNVRIYDSCFLPLNLISFCFFLPQSIIFQTQKLPSADGERIFDRRSTPKTSPSDRWQNVPPETLRTNLQIRNSV